MQLLSHGTQLADERERERDRRPQRKVGGGGALCHAATSAMESAKWRTPRSASDAERVPSDVENVPVLVDVDDMI